MQWDSPKLCNKHDMAQQGDHVNSIAYLNVEQRSQPIIPLLLVAEFHDFEDSQQADSIPLIRLVLIFLNMQPNLVVISTFLASAWS